METLSFFQSHLGYLFLPPQDTNPISAHLGPTDPALPASKPPWEHGLSPTPPTHHIRVGDGGRYPGPRGIPALVLIHLLQHLALVDVRVQEQPGGSETPSSQHTSLSLPTPGVLLCWPSTPIPGRSTCSGQGWAAGPSMQGRGLGRAPRDQASVAVCLPP